jgi:hypothetical protein
MKKILFILIIVSTFVSCTEHTYEKPKYWDSSTMFIITGITREKSMDRNVIYEVEVVDPNEFSYDANTSSNNLIFEFTDSIGKYNVGQAIHFTKF